MSDVEIIELVNNHVSFIKQYIWLINFPMIKIFQQNVLHHLPKDWMEFWHSQYNSENFVANLSNTSSCKSLQKYVTTCTKFSMEGSYGQQFIMNLPLDKKNSNTILLRNVSKKKCYEISKLMQLVDALGTVVDCGRILDIGSGLGYVDLCLHKDLNYTIYGIECNEKTIVAANKLKEKYVNRSCPNLDYVALNMNDGCNSEKCVEALITKLSTQSSHCSCSTGKFPPKVTGSAIMISLHSCGDLTPSMIRTFINQPLLSAAIIMPCCYHKMKFDSGKANNFPLSDKLAAIMTKEKLSINVCGLRLAAEESLASIGNKSMQEFSRDVQCISFRAILNTVCDRDLITLLKLKRRCVKKNEFNTFEEYISAALQNYQFNKFGKKLDESALSVLQCKLKDEFTKCKDLLPYVALVRILQLHMQPVIETLIHLDRLFYLTENGISNCGLVQLFDKTLSPRNTAIVCLKK